MKRSSIPAYVLRLSAAASIAAALMALLIPSTFARAAPAPVPAAGGMVCTYMADWQTAKDHQRTAERVLVVALKPLPSQRPGAWVRSPRTQLEYHVAAADLFNCE